jgi:AraC-like DNA-binding protein
VYDVRCRVDEHGRSPEEWSREDHIVFPRSGVFVRHVEGQDVVADPNHVLFFARDETYKVSHPVGCGDDCTVFSFAPELLREVAPRDERERLFAPTHLATEHSVFLLHESLRQACQAAQRDALAIDEAALALLDALLLRAGRQHEVAQPRRASTHELHRDQSQRTKLFLASSFAEPLALDDVARAVHSSVFHLARIFRRETGISIHQYRHRLRLRASLDRLVSGARDLSELAQELGFSSHSHLTDSFRAAFGLSPSACRSIDGARLRELSKNLEV